MAGALRNVLVFRLGHARWAVELRWVREIERIVALTPVPGAPPVIAGAVNLRGQIVPVLGPSALPRALGGAARGVRRGDQAILIDVDGVAAALPADRIDEVTTVSDVDATAAERADGGSGGDGDDRNGGDAHAIGGGGASVVVTQAGERVRLLEPASVLAEARARIEDAAVQLSRVLWGAPR